MKQRIKTIVTSLAILFGLVAFQAPLVAAAPVDVFPSASCGSNTTVCANKNNNTIYTIVKNIINVLFLAAGIIAVIMIIIGGINYAISSGDKGKLESAKNTVLYAVIGLIIAALAFPIVTFVVDRLF